MTDHLDLRKKKALAWSGVDDDEFQQQENEDERMSAIMSLVKNTSKSVEVYR